MPSTLCIVICIGSQGGLVQIPLHNLLFRVQSPLSTCPKVGLVSNMKTYIHSQLSTPYFIRPLSKALSDSIISVSGTIIPLSGADPPLTFCRWFQQSSWLQPTKRHVRKIEVIKHWNQSSMKIRNISTGNSNGNFNAMVIAETRQRSNAIDSVEWL